MKCILLWTIPTCTVCLFFCESDYQNITTQSSDEMTDFSLLMYAGLFQSTARLHSDLPSSNQQPTFFHFSIICFPWMYVTIQKKWNVTTSVATLRMFTLKSSLKEPNFFSWPKSELSEKRLHTKHLGSFTLTLRTTYLIKSQHFNNHTRPYRNLNLNLISCAALAPGCVLSTQNFFAHFVSSSTAEWETNKLHPAFKAQTLSLKNIQDAMGHKIHLKCFRPTIRPKASWHICVFPQPTQDICHRWMNSIVVEM